MRLGHRAVPILRNHLSTWASDAIKDGMGEEIIAEGMGALKYNKSLLVM